MNFKRILLILTSVIATLALTVACLPLMSMADDQIVVKNNAYEDFSTTQNPSGVWSYEYRVKNPDNSYTYTPLTFDGSVWGSDALGTITTTASCMETYKPALRFKASNDLVTELVLTYTAPENGTVQVIMDNGGVFSTTRNADNYIRFSMLHNGRVIKNVEDLDSDYNAFNPFFGDAQVLTVKKNDIIRFVVGKNAASRGTINTDMNPVINYALVEAEKPTEYEAAAEYKSGSVDGQWRYYSRNSAGLYAPLAVNGNFWGVGANCSIDYTDADSITGKRAINMHSGLDLDPTLAFVAPFTGTMEVSMANGGVYCPNSGFDGVNLTVYINDTLYFESKVNSVNSHEGYRVWADVKTITVTAGDIIYFSINKNANTSGDVVFLNPYIKYTEVIGEYDSTLRFLDTDVIETTNLYKDSFDISWPAARGGIADFTYEVFASKTPITGIPTEGGIDVGATRMYSFTGLEAGTAYYIAVVATDGVSKAVLYNNNPVNTISKMFVFNAYDDYKTENQKSPWGYEALSSEKHQKLDWNNGIWGNEATTGAVYSATSDLVTGKPALVLSPSSSGAAVLTFTAPYTGTLDISIANGGIMVPYNGEGNGYDGVNFKLTQNEKVIVKHDAVSAANCHSSAMGAFYKGRLFTETLNLSVKAGDIIRFTVDMNKATGNDMTFINPEIIYTSVVEGALDLHFEEGKQITGSGITKSEITVIIPTAFGGTGNYEYTLYTSKKPITAIPSSGGIKLGENSSYTLKGLTAYTNYYFAATVSDGTNTASIINSKAISTIGNTYTFNACEDWSDKGQPINTPWRYYMQEIETGKYTEMSWNSEQASFEDKAIAPSISFSIADSDMVTGAKTVVTHPDTNYNAAIGFIAPYDGTVTLDALNGGVFSPLNGSDGINFTVLKGKKVLYTKSGINGYNNHSDRCFAAGISVKVKKGEMLYFVVNQNSNTASDTTFFNPRVSYTFVEKGSDDFAFMSGASVSGSDITENGFTVNWSSAFGPDGSAVNYKVWMSSSAITKQPSGKPIYDGKDLSTKVKGLGIGKRFYFYVKATDAKGNVAVLNPKESIRTISPIYNAYEQYNTTNGAGVWNYTLRDIDISTVKYFYSLAKANDDGSYGDANSTGIIHITPSESVTGKPAIMMHPGINNKSSALVFTAPYSGEISLYMANGGVFCPNNSEQHNYDGIKFILLKDEEEVLVLDTVSAENNEEGSRLFADPITLNINQGEKLYFVVEDNTSNAADITFFNPVIEYLNITGGTGKVALEGFVIPETLGEEGGSTVKDPLLIVFTRDNKFAENTEVKNATFGPEPEDNSWGLWVILGGLGFVIVGGAVIVLLNIKGKKKKF